MNRAFPATSPERLRALSARLFLPAAFLVFTASGFAGLIYESIWSHYLKLFLGHAAYAQTVVLAIFMGGMAAGAWLASRLSPRWRNLLLAYTLIEALIGLAGLAFHDVFVSASSFALDRAIPALGSPAAIHAFKWTLATLLILPQSVLLGMTFPLMTGGVLRLRPQRAGYAIAMLYFTNSLGAALGALASAFYLIPTVGLPGTLVAAAIVNFCVAGAVMLLPRDTGTLAPESTPRPASTPPQLNLLLTVAALTGLSSFMYEIGWIRMLALVLGSSTHAFELMLSAFIFGLAFGGLWVRRRIDSAHDTVRLLAVVQVVMGLAALATLPIYGSSFRFMQATLTMLAPSASGYVAFNLASHAICLAVMFPAAFCAGMTLPLITASLLRQGGGERVIGQVYAANTAGAIAGVLIAVHAGFALLGLKGLIIAGAVIDLALGVLLLAAQPQGRRTWAPAAAAVAGVAVLGALLGVELNAHHMASGVYRQGHLIPDRQAVKLHLDGKTATVSVTADPQLLTLRTNGKPDGSVRTDDGPPAPDEITMTLAALLPQFLAPEARRVANIGFGTGMTTHVLLASPRIEVVDTVEIEPAIVEGARSFRRYNWRAYDDPRSRIHYEDAKTYFSAQQQVYDVIVSEPSNPWVSGVASLFSTEFYRDVRRYLRDGGLFVQWIQLYEMAPVLLSTVIGALDANFADYEFWLANDSDMIIVAVHNGKVPRPDAAAFANPELQAPLERFLIKTLDDLHLHRLGGRQALQPYFASFGAAPNSDFFPILEFQAPLSRYMRAGSGEIVNLLELAAPVVALFDGDARRAPDPARLSAGTRQWGKRASWPEQALAGQRFVRSGNEAMLAPIAPELATDLILLRAALVDCKLRLPAGALRTSVGNAARGVSAHLPRAEAASFWDTLGRRQCGAAADAGDRGWVRLHRAVAAGVPADIAAAAKSVLEAEPDLTGTPLAQALTGYMAGEILNGRAREAMRAFVEHRGRLGAAARDWEGVFRLLVGQASYGMR
jgi:spermidine synthase